MSLRQAPDWTFSVSIGSASWLPEDGKLKAIDLLAQADRALYAAKRSRSGTASTQTKGTSNHHDIVTPEVEEGASVWVPDGGPSGGHPAGERRRRLRAVLLAWEESGTRPL